MSSYDNLPAPLPHPHPTRSFWHSEPSKLLLAHRSTRHLPKHASTVIVGAGITGASAAWHLIRSQSHDHKDSYDDSGPEVLLLESREVCWGATGRNGGHCQPLIYSHPSSPDIGRFELLNHATLTSLAGADVPDPSEKPYYPAPLPTPDGKRHLFPCECVVQTTVHAAYEDSEAEMMRTGIARLGETDPEVAAHCKVISDEEGLAGLRVPTAKMAIVTDVAARLWPYKLVAGVVEELLLDPDVGKRFNLQTYTDVLKVEVAVEDSADGWVVTTDRGEVHADRVILATNAYTSYLMPEYKDLIVPNRGTMSALEPSKELKDGNRLVASFGFQAAGGKRDGYLIQRPNESGGHLMFGGAGNYGSLLGDPDDSKVDPRARAALVEGLPEIFGLKDRTPLEAAMVWTGIMGYSRDKHPLVGPVPGKDGVFMAAGFTGHGMPNTWLSGRAVAEMVWGLQDGKSEAEAIEAAVKATHLPKSYLLTSERLAALAQAPKMSQKWSGRTIHGS